MHSDLQRSGSLTHHPVAPDPDYVAGLSFLGNRLPDREARVEEFFVGAAMSAPAERLLGGNGWAVRLCHRTFATPGMLALHSTMRSTPRPAQC